MLRILLAEDNPGDIHLVRQCLRRHAIENELHVVQDGEEGIRYVVGVGGPGEPPCPDVILLDLNLPKADGLDVLREFRKSHTCLGTRVIVVTSSDAPRDRARAAELGIDYYFCKPSSFNEFMRLGAVVKELTAG